MSYEFPDVDTLMEIAKNDPDALDRIKHDAVEDLINSASQENQQRLRGLQWQVDMGLTTSKTPMERCVRVSEMMHEKLWELRAALQNSDDADMTPMFDETVDAKILPFQS